MEKTAALESQRLFFAGQLLVALSIIEPLQDESENPAVSFPDIKIVTICGSAPSQANFCSERCVFSPFKKFNSIREKTEQSQKQMSSSTKTQNRPLRNTEFQSYYLCFPQQFPSSQPVENAGKLACERLEKLAESKRSLSLNRKID